ncbi:MAG: Crp/Fnr family transcriptional regulator, partial [Tabrizicola sp.]|nr:Crp/Fnr family transcriptional regulator [Tabrizicola sp.]
MTWLDRFDELRDLPADVAERLNRQTRIIRLAPGTQVFAPGQQAANMLLVLGGTVRVQQTSDTGRDVYLYRVHA